jgi:hypothetical protein
MTTISANLRCHRSALHWLNPHTERMLRNRFRSLAGCEGCRTAARNAAAVFPVGPALPSGVIR